MLKQGVAQAHAREGAIEVDALALVLDLAGARHGPRDLAEQALGEVHHVLVVGQGLVELEHGELGVVLGGHPLVAEVAVDLEHPLEAAHHQALEVQLGRDPEEHVHVEGVVMGPEGSGDRAPGQGLHHRRLDLEEVPLDEEGADAVYGPAPPAEGLPRGFARDEVDVATAVAQLGVAEAVPLLGQRVQALGEEADLGRAHRELAGAGAEHRPAHRDEVADVEAPKLRVDSLGQVVAADEELDASRDVPEVGERGLAHHPARHEPARDGNPRRLRRELLRGHTPVARLELARLGVAPEVVGIGPSFRPQRLELLPALPDLLALLLDHRPQTPALRLASMKRSRSPSSTAWVLPISIPVRKSLMRDWSST